MLKINNLMQRVEKINNSLPQIYPNLHSNRPLYEIIKLDPRYIANNYSYADTKSNGRRLMKYNSQRPRDSRCDGLTRVKM